MDETPPDFHTMAARNAFKKFHDGTSSWMEYQDFTVVFMMRIVYDSLTLALNPFVVAMTDTIRGITDCIEAITYGKGFEQGSLKVNAMYVQWKDDPVNAFATVRPGDANVSMDKHNVSAVLRMIKQRSGSDTVLVMMADTSGNRADSQVLETTQAIAGVELGIGLTPLENPPKDLFRAWSPRKAVRASSSKQTTAESPQKPAHTTMPDSNSVNVHKRAKEGKKSRRPVETTGTGGPGLEDFEEGEVVETPTTLTGPQDQPPKRRLAPKPRQPARKLSPSPRFPQSFHDAQREAAEKRRHRHSSENEDNARHRQKMDDSPGAGRRDRRRDDPYGYG